jgi:F-type H+-transporting ATPase subunit delta
MNTEGVGRVYARALFEAAGEAETVDRVREQLSAFVAALDASPPLRAALQDPQIDIPAKSRVLAGVTGGGSPLLQNALRLMLERGRLNAIQEVNEEYERLAAELERRVEVEVTSAVPLQPDVEQTIVSRVQAATGRTVRLSKRVDPGVIGGLVIQVGDVVLDASLRARAAQLRTQMQRAR